nr:translation initiation factor IF-2-like [Manis javanica]
MAKTENRAVVINREVANRNLHWGKSSQQSRDPGGHSPDCSSGTRSGRPGPRTPGSSGPGGPRELRALAGRACSRPSGARLLSPGQEAAPPLQRAPYGGEVGRRQQKPVKQEIHPGRAGRASGEDADLLEEAGLPLGPGAGSHAPYTLPPTGPAPQSRPRTPAPPPARAPGSPRAPSHPAARALPLLAQLSRLRPAPSCSTARAQRLEPARSAGKHPREQRLRRPPQRLLLPRSCPRVRARAAVNVLSQPPRACRPLPGLRVPNRRALPRRAARRLVPGRANQVPGADGRRDSAPGKPRRKEREGGGGRRLSRGRDVRAAAAAAAATAAAAPAPAGSRGPRPGSGPAGAPACQRRSSPASLPGGGGAPPDLALNEQEKELQRRLKRLNPAVDEQETHPASVLEAEGQVQLHRPFSEQPAGALQRYRACVQRWEWGHRPDASAAGPSPPPRGSVPSEMTRRPLCSCEGEILGSGSIH